MTNKAEYKKIEKVIKIYKNKSNKNIKNKSINQSIKYKRNNYKFKNLMVWYKGIRLN